MIRRLFVLIATVLLIGCGSAAPPTVPDQPTGVPTQAIAPTITPTRAPTRTPALIIPPTTTAASLIVAPPGLLYITGDRMAAEHPLWIVDATGRTRMIEENVMDAGGFPDFDISPDGTEMLYAFEGDIWRIDIDTGTPFNLTNTPDRIERAPQWIGQERAFVCGSMEVGTEGASTGQLTYVNLDELTYKIVDEAFMTGIPAPHPSGEFVLYATYATESGIGGFDLKEYRLADESIVPVNAADYGLSEYVITSRPDAPDVLYTGSLSWNADGTKLGMALLGQVEDAERGIIVVIDWATKQPELLHTANVPGIEAPFFSSAPRFPLQADWLVFQAPPANFGNTEVILWEAGEAHGVSGEMIVRSQWGEHPAISRDDQWVAFLTSDGLALMRTGEWNPVVTSTQDVVIGVGWVTPPE